jgi:hypothetical protein
MKIQNLCVWTQDRQVSSHLLFYILNVLLAALYLVLKHVNQCGSCLRYT